MTAMEIMAVRRDSLDFTFTAIEASKLIIRGFDTNNAKHWACETGQDIRLEISDLDQI